MKNKSFIITITVVITLLCLYYLQFSMVARSVQQDAREYATDASGKVDFQKSRAYLDSVWNLPVYNFLGKEYTYKEVKETELSLGLDLQGGMHVTLEVSPEDIIKGLSSNPTNQNLVDALRQANKMQANSQEPFADLFYRALKQIDPDSRLVEYFVSAANRERFNMNMSDEEVLSIIRREVDGAIDRSYQIIRARIDQFGTASPNIQRIQGSGRISIELPGVENQERVRKLLQGVAKLEFLEVVEFAELSDAMQGINSKLLEEEQLKLAQGKAESDTAPAASQQEDLSELLQDQDATSDTSDLEAALESDTTEAGLDSLANTQVSSFLSMISYPYGIVNLKDTAKVNRILRRLMQGDLKGYVPSNVKFLWANKPQPSEGSGEQMIYLYVVRTQRDGTAPLTGEVITDATQTFDERSNPAVSMSMNAVGAKKWARMTEENTGRRIAIVLDNQVYSAPNVNERIPTGQSQISGNFTAQEAQDLANILKAGALPARARIVEEAVVGPSLGKEAQHQGFTSIFAGLAVVVLFMIAYYAKGGLIANAALLFNIFFILGILAQPGLGAALTLPGIAGIVLTMGMAVDANVLIFERIREELRVGRPLLQAIDQGYSKAYSSIIDSNVTTFLTAAILFAFGLGPVRGFATTLMIGIICSFFTAVFVARVIVTWTSKKGDKSKLSFETAFSKNLLTGINFDFMTKRKVAYMFSSAIIVIGIALMIIKGPLKYGVDFTGGRSYIVAFNEAVVPSDLKTSFSDDFEEAGSEVKTYGSNEVLKITTGYLINDESTEADQQVRQTLINGIAEFTGFTYNPDGVGEGEFTIQGSSKVGASIADDIKSSSVWAVIFSLIGIFIYILIRFKKWQYSSGAVVALIHDSLFVIASFSIARLFGVVFEVDQVFIAAMLTIIGYSINDTVVVFDRIRETLYERPHEKLKDSFNLSINNTLSRTVMTSFTTLIVVLTLLIFGGEVLRGFSFALFIGIVAGTFSSIFIATPVVYDLSKKLMKQKGEI